jgi:hypothetical protein
MRRVIVQYKVKKERVGEHEALVREVFAELAQAVPPGIRYVVFKQPDGVGFVHVAFVDAPKNPLNALRAFQAFTAHIDERCETPPEVVELAEIGAYGF